MAKIDFDANAPRHAVNPAIERTLIEEPVSIAANADGLYALCRDGRVRLWAEGQWWKLPRIYGESLGNR